MKKFEMGGTSFTADSNDPMIGGTMASSMATGGGTKSAFDSTKARLKGKTQEYRINKLIEAVKKTNWSSNPLTVDSGIVKVYSNMYDLEPTRVASIFNKYQKENKMKKGGSLKGKAKYVPNYMVQSVEVERKGKTTDIDGGNILDGVYVKKGVKFAKGGGLKDIGFENSNLYLYGFGKDTNGNSIVKVGFPNQRAFSIQTNGILKFTHDKRGYKLSELDSNDVAKIEKEVVGYVKEHGSKDQKSRLKIYGKMEWGGTAESSETGVSIGGENQSSMYENGGELNETFPDTDAMSYAGGGGVGDFNVGDIVKIKSGYSQYDNKNAEIVKIMPDNKTLELKIKHKVGNEYVKFEKKEVEKYSNGGRVGSWTYEIGGL